MDRNLFADDAPGRLVEIRMQEGADWAFIPAPLPNVWEIQNDLWPLLAQEREALRSSSLEGTYATPEQLLLSRIKNCKIK